MGDFDKVTHVRLLLELIKICNEGAIKPFDSAQVIKNLSRVNNVSKGVVEEVMKCCAPSAEVRDAKDFIAYREAALIKVSELLDLEVYK